VVVYEDASPNVGATPSPAASDKENLPSSTLPPTAIKAARQQQQPLLSPTKTTRVPLAAPGTPNRSPARLQLSPSKQLQHLTSTHSWSAIDLDAVLLASPQPTPGRLGAQLVAAAGGLSEEERGMSVEEWVRYRAKMGEEGLKRKCEGLVEVFEREGVRGLETLQGISSVV